MLLGIIVAIVFMVILISSTIWTIKAWTSVIKFVIPLLKKWIIVKKKINKSKRS